ncbi:MAG: hemerythrin family protein [Aquificae bacterium]|nr:hemerythrin family protein [Aquificota bacterium]
MLLDKSLIPKVAVEKMNQIHDVEIDILNKLYESIEKYEKNESSLEEIEHLFEEFLKDVQEHFSFEQGLMEEYNFFAYPMHKGEHDRVLMELDQLKRKFEKSKDPSLLKSYLSQIFVPWIVNHVQTMDTVTAHFLSHFVRD